VQCGAAWCSVVQCNAVWCNAMFFASRASGVHACFFPVHVCDPLPSHLSSSSLCLSTPPPLLHLFLSLFHTQVHSLYRAFSLIYAYIWACVSGFISSVYVCVYIYIQLVCICIYIYICIYACVYMYCICTHTHTHTHIHTTHTDTRIYMYIYI